MNTNEVNNSGVYLPDFGSIKEGITNNEQKKLEDYYKSQKENIDNLPRIIDIYGAANVENMSFDELKMIEEQLKLNRKTVDEMIKKENLELQMENYK